MNGAYDCSGSLLGIDGRSGRHLAQRPEILAEIAL